MHIVNGPIVMDYTSKKNTAGMSGFSSKVMPYLSSLFPIFQWVHRYNGSWFLQDAIAGITVGMMLVPQGMAYAKVANLDPQYGLYSSFVGTCLYCLFGTSKDVSIGPITVVSLLVGQAVTNVTASNPTITGPDVAVCLALVTGLITLLIGLVRLGSVVDVISGPAIAGYMSGSAITIGLGQWPGLFGMTKVGKNNPPYQIFLDFVTHITTDTHVDAAFGITGLVLLYVIKYGASYASSKWPRWSRLFFFIQIMRSALIVIVGTFVSFAIGTSTGNTPFKVIGQVPAGLDAIGLPKLDFAILEGSMDLLPSIVLIMVLEHVSVATSFGRMNGYFIDANQEILAIGVGNIVSAFFGGYPTTGAFSRTAIMSRSGSKTPFSGFFSGLVVISALFVLTPTFYYIPQAILSAIVIHAVSDLVSGPKYLRQLYRTSRLELLVFLVAVVITCVQNVELGIYVAIVLSLVILLVRLSRLPVKTLAMMPLSDNSIAYVDECNPNFNDRCVSPPNGIVILRLCNPLIYLNAGHVTKAIAHTLRERSKSCSRHDKELLWNEGAPHDEDAMQVPLQAVILDFSGIEYLDSTALQLLSSLKNTIDTHAGQSVEWHFVQLQNAHVRQSLIHYGYGSLGETSPYDSGATSFSDDPTQLQSVVSHVYENPKRVSHFSAMKHEVPIRRDDVGPLPGWTKVPIDTYPCFHWDIDSAIEDIRRRHDSDRVM